MGWVDALLEGGWNGQVLCLARVSHVNKCYAHKTQGSWKVVTMTILWLYRKSCRKRQSYCDNIKVVKGDTTLRFICVCRGWGTLERVRKAICLLNILLCICLLAWVNGRSYSYWLVNPFTLNLHRVLLTLTYGAIPAIPSVSVRAGLCASFHSRAVGSNTFAGLALCNWVTLKSSVTHQSAHFNPVSAIWNNAIHEAAALPAAQPICSTVLAPILTV